MWHQTEEQWEARLRREYLYRKSLEEKELLLYEKKQKIKLALDEGRPIPRELRTESAALGEQVIFDPNFLPPSTHVDDEYATACLRDPKIVITTSRDPSSRLVQFAKELSLVFPTSQRINRGNYVIDQLVGTCKTNDVTDLICVHEHRGVPDGMIISHLPHGPTAFFTLFNVVLRHDAKSGSSASKTVSEAYPHLVFDQFSSKLGNRVVNILKYLFPVPKPDSRRVMSFVNQSDYISFRHHTFKKGPKGRDIELEEVGPRFEMRPYEIKLGTLDISEADVEWVLRPYMNSARKRDVL